MRSKTVILLVLALGCGLVASIGISQILQRQDQGPAGDTAPVWVVMTDIKRERSADHAELEARAMAERKDSAGALSKLEEIDGKRAKVALYAGEAVLDKKILGKDEQDFSNEVPPGFRAVHRQCRSESARTAACCIPTTGSTCWSIVSEGEPASQRPARKPFWKTSWSLRSTIKCGRRNDKVNRIDLGENRDAAGHARPSRKTGAGQPDRQDQPDHAQPVRQRLFEPQRHHAARHFDHG